jgi:AAA15 family ATPase/GTPase
MLQEITIKNFKSIADDTIELGRVNVFIGENGCGKSNILEAVGFASVAETYETIDADILYANGIRVTKPSLMLSSFKGSPQKTNIEIALAFDDTKTNCIVSPNNKGNIYSKWTRKLRVDTEANSLDTTASIITLLLEGIDNSLQNEQISDKTKIQLKEISIQLNFKNTNSYQILSNYIIYTLNTQALRGIPEFINSRKGIYGENLDTLIAELDEQELEELKSYTYFIDWLDDFFIDTNDQLKQKGYKLNHSKSLLYFKDKLMLKAHQNNIFSTENANEGVLHILFHLATVISKNTPKFFAIDNIETALNPHLCRYLMKELCTLAKKYDKQLLITTHNPAILDGLNLFDDEIRLFEVARNDKGHTKTRRIKVKPDKFVENYDIEKIDLQRFKLSELWTRGFLGAISDNF